MDQIQHLPYTEKVAKHALKGRLSNLISENPRYHRSIDRIKELLFKIGILMPTPRDRYFIIDRGIRNEIVSVTGNTIFVASEKTKRRRLLPKADFRRCWNILTQNGQLSIPPVHVWNERIVMAFLAHLPCVEYSIRPLTLHFVLENTHPSCTTLKRPSRKIQGSS